MFPVLIRYAPATIRCGFSHDTDGHAARRFITHSWRYTFAIFWTTTYAISRYVFRT